MAEWLRRDREANGPVGLRVLVGLCGFMAIVGVAMALIGLLGNLTGSRSVEVEINQAEFEIAAVSDTADEDAFVADAVIGTIESSTGAHFVASVGEAAQALSVALIAVALGLVVNTARKADPFVRANLFRLRIATVAPMVGFAGAMVEAVGHMMATESAGFVPQSELTFGWVIVALIFGALGEIWRSGVELREDLELTI